LYEGNHLIIIGIITVLFIFSASFSYFAGETHQALARCPNGYHKSPSGDCEKVVPHQGLPRCPNGYHRSPSGICEAVNDENSEGSNDNNIGEDSSASTDDNITPSPSMTPLPSSTLASQCDQSLWNHIYNPNRLQIVNPCMSITGIIDSIRVEKDGDYHIRLKVDPQFSNLINSANIKGQYGDLVLEPICQKPITQQDAIAACANFHQNISIPPVGTHVNVTGSYVLDKEHGRWAEIHPVTSIIKGK
jgi:hypothetical protein